MEVQEGGAQVSHLGISICKVATSRIVYDIMYPSYVTITVALTPVREIQERLCNNVWYWLPNGSI